MRRLGAAAAFAATLVACSAAGDEPGPADPALAAMEWLRHAEVRCTDYDGITDDLLTAGLGKRGLAGGGAGRRRSRQPDRRRNCAASPSTTIIGRSSTSPPAAATAASTARTCCADGTVTANEGLIAGTECLAYADDGSGRKNVTLMVQMPASSILAIPASSPAPPRVARHLRRHRHQRRVGPEERLRRRLHRQGHRHRRARPAERHRQSDRRRTRQRRLRRRGFQLHGPHQRRRARRLQRRNAQSVRLQARPFPAEPASRVGRRCRAGDPVRLHRTQSPHYPEAAIVTRQQHRHRFQHLQRRRRLAARSGNRPTRPDRRHRRLRAERQSGARRAVRDRPGRPATVPRRQSARRLPDTARRLPGLRQPVAAGGAVEQLCRRFSATNRCASLRTKGCCRGDTRPSRRAEAQAIINDDGFLREQNIVQPSHWTLRAAGRRRHLCQRLRPRPRAGQSLRLQLRRHRLRRRPRSPSPATPRRCSSHRPTASRRRPASTSSTMPRSGGPKQDTLSVSPSTGALDQNLDGALCLRALWTGQHR